MKAVVIGAGIGGLSAAAFLAKRGIHNTVLEKNSHIGGRVREWKDSGYRFDLGPSCYHMPHEYEAWFESFGVERRSFYEIERVNTPYKLFFKDDLLEVPTEKDKLIQLFDAVEPGAGSRLQGLLYEAARNYQYLMPHVIRKNTHGLINKIRLASLGLRYVGLRSLLQNYHHKIQQVATDHRLQKILASPLLLLSADVKALPSIYTTLTHLEVSHGLWQPMGGFSRVTDAMAKVVRSLGVRIVTNAEVQSFEWKNNKRISAVCTADRSFDTDIVVANADRHFVDQLLLHEKKRDFSAKRWKRMPISHGVLNICWGVRNALTNFAAHTFFLDASWNEHMSALQKKAWPSNPLFYVHCPSKIDSSAAPEGGNVLCVRVPIAAGMSDSRHERAAVIARVLTRLAPYVDSGTFPAAIESEHIMCLSDFERDYNAFKGNAYGMSMTLGQSAMFRLNNKAKHVKNLYYAGQYTIPGTGTTMSMISGELVAQRIATEWRM